MTTTVGIVSTRGTGRGVISNSAAVIAAAAAPVASARRRLGLLPLLG